MRAARPCHGADAVAAGEQPPSDVAALRGHRFRGDGAASRRCRGGEVRALPPRHRLRGEGAVAARRR
ncbi:MAG: hypothetical protein HS111_16830 [Kofleriaceae bacterium]|nr:hypothetical protein [Kofleriaceae bacterium]